MNLKRIFIYILLGFILFIIIYLFYKIDSGIANRNEIAGKRARFPDICLYNMKGEKYCPKRLNNSNSTVIIFFNTECQHCTYEIENIINNAGSFINTTILIISDQPVKILKRFSLQNELYKYPQIEILYADYQHIVSFFGTIVIPETFIYNKDNDLLKVFRGEVGAEAILKTINSK